MIAECKNISIIKYITIISAAFLPLASAACSAQTEKITAGWQDYEIPRNLSGYAREKYLIDEMERQSKASLEGKGDLITPLRPSEKMADPELSYHLLSSAMTEDRAVYTYFAPPYRGLIGGFGPAVQFCKVEVPLAALPKEQTHAEAIRVADDIFRTGNCKASAPRSDEYRRLKAESENQ